MMEYTKTELHTHLVGMLSAEEFVDFIKKCDIDSFLFDDKIVNLIKSDWGTSPMKSHQPIKLGGNARSIR